MRFSITIFFAAVAALTACETPPPETAEAAAPHLRPARLAATDNTLIPGTPAGDLADWVHDIRTGLADLPELAASDRAAAQSRALDLYVTRQEYAEMYFGIDGRQRQDDRLAAAIETAETRFHDLMKLLAQGDPPADAVRAAVAALDTQQATVVRLWRQSGTKLQRPAE